MAASSVGATTRAAVRSLGVRAFVFALAGGLAAGFPPALLLPFLTTAARVILRPPIGSILRTYGSRAAIAAPQERYHAFRFQFTPFAPSRFGLALPPNNRWHRTRFVRR